jgi:hypothetical protein
MEDVDRRGFLGRVLGALTILPNLGHGNIKVALSGHKLIGKIGTIAMNYDMGLIGGQYVSMSSLVPIRPQDETTKQHMWTEAGFGVIILYLDPRGLFQVRETNANI